MRVAAQGHTEGGAGKVHVLFEFDFLQAAQLAPFYVAVQRIMFALVMPLWHFSTPGWCSGDDTRTSHYYASVRASEDLCLPRHGAGLAEFGS